MFKRRESKLQSDNRRHAARTSKRKRRLTLEGLEQRQLMAANVLPTSAIFSGPRNVGSVQAFSVIESEGTGEQGVNDTFATAQFVPLGTAAGKRDTIDIRGTLPFTFTTGSPAILSDLDTYAFDLQAGDILDISGTGAVGSVNMFYGFANSFHANGGSWFSTDTPQAAFYPINSPLQTAGNITIAQVVPETGRYYLTVAPGNTNSNYTLGLRAYRPITEKLPIGSQQVLFLDFDGAVVPATSFGLPNFGVIRVPSLQESLPILGIQEQNTAALNQMIDRVVEEVEFHYSTIAKNGTNGDFATTGVPGQFGVTILNSRDHQDPGNDPFVTRLLIGGDSLATIGQLTNGIAQTIDVGNFRLDDVVYIGVEGVFAEASSVPISTSESLLTATAVRLSSTVSHEAAHALGLRHTDNTNTVATIIDTGGIPNVTAQRLGLGPDGVFGTLDDERIEFRPDRYDAAEGIFGINRAPESLSWVLSTGKVGSGGGTGGGGNSPVTGVIFNDVNRNGINDSEAGLGGFTVFADVNGNGIQDSVEASTVTGPNGSYTLNVGGTFNIIAVAPTAFLATTPTSKPATSGRADFGFVRVQPDVTGFTFIDENQDGVLDASDRPLEGIYVYLDLDGDNRADLGEPSAVSGSDGSYRINFPGAGTYTIRQVLPAGIQQTSPATGEHIVFFNGSALTDNYNFGNFEARDYGDAPESYGTTRAAGGPSHGITTGLTLGVNIDRDSNGQPTANATGDDTNGSVDDEDGVQLASPLAPGAAATFQVTTVNTTGSAAYLQAWMDFNQNGVFESSEKVITNRQLGSGTNAISVNVPASTTVGNVFARFRYSSAQNLGPGGDADNGEVEDYQFQILNAAEIVNDDDVSVPRNTPVTIDVLGNDFDPSGTLAINNLNTVGTLGTVRVASNGRSVIYTPPNGFVGQTSFGYTVRNGNTVVVGDNGQPIEGRVLVNVTFQSNQPIAIDDSFVVPQGSVNRALNVLDNDVPSLSGGLTIASVTTGDNGGTVRIIGGGQSLSYTPLPGFTGTEQFTYSVIDGQGNPDSATVTVNLSPGSVADDKIAFTFQTLDALNNTPISSIQAGQTFKLRVFVEDLDSAAFRDPGVASAFLDLLYTDELVTPVDSDPSDTRPFDITFGPLFTGGGSFQQQDSFAPGLLDDIGAVQSNVANPTSFTDTAELFTVTMRATAAGVAVFQADPPDNVVSDTILIDQDVRLTASQMFLGRTELVIGPASDNFTSAIDDAYRVTDNTGTTTSQLDVLTNDLIRREELGGGVLGNELDIIEFGLLNSASLGFARINAGDDFISYTPNTGASGLDTLTYFIVTADGTRSTADVSVFVGDPDDIDYLVGIQYSLTDAAGNLVSNPTINVGDRFGVRITVDDVRGGFDETLVFAAFQDILYDADAIRVSDSSTADRFDFDVTFGTNFDPNSAVGTAARPGIIDEFGTQDVRGAIPPGTPLEDPRTLATIFFVARQAGTTTIIGSPADASPSQDTLLLDRDEPVPRSLINYGSLQVTIGGAEGEFPLHNSAMATDVNADGVVSPIDALVIINELNRQFFAELQGEAPAANQGLARFYTDVNADKNVTALDALTVINYLNAQALAQASGELARLSAEGEFGSAVATDVLPSVNGNESAAASSDINDAAIVTLSDDDSNISADSAQPSSSIDFGSVMSDDADTDADEDDVLLSLLADDVAGLWS